MECVGELGRGGRGGGSNAVLEGYLPIRSKKVLIVPIRSPNVRL